MVCRNHSGVGFGGGREALLISTQAWQQLLWLTSFLLSFRICHLKGLAASFPQLCLQGAFIWRNRSVHLEVLLLLIPKKNLRNFFQMGQFSSDFAAYLSALSLWQTPLTGRHRVIGLSMGRKLWPWAQSERIWLSGASCEPPLNYKDWALTRLFKGASYTTTVSAFPSWAVVFHSAYYDQVWSGLYTGSIYPLEWG